MDVKVSTSTQLRVILYTDSQNMLVLSSTVASRYYNYCTDWQQQSRKLRIPPRASHIQALAMFETKVLTSVYGPIKDNNDWEIWHNCELYVLYIDMDINDLYKSWWEGWNGLVM
jgi:hypothetical protein